MHEPHTAPPDDDLLLRGVVVLNARAVGLALGTVSALALVVATNVLVLKGGDPVGPHLALLSQFFIGYHVSVAGSLIGALWAFAVGSVVGSALGWTYNVVAGWRQRSAVQRERQRPGARE